MTNDDVPTEQIERLRVEHRALDGQIETLRASGSADEVEVARLKKRKLRLRDEIALLNDRSIPDILA